MKYPVLSTGLVNLAQVGERKVPAGTKDAFSRQFWMLFCGGAHLVLPLGS